MLLKEETSVCLVLNVNFKITSYFGLTCVNLQKLFRNNDLEVLVLTMFAQLKYQESYYTLL